MTNRRTASLDALTTDADPPRRKRKREFATPKQAPTHAELVLSTTKARHPRKIEWQLTMPCGHRIYHEAVVGGWYKRMSSSQVMPRGLEQTACVGVVECAPPPERVRCTSCEYCARYGKFRGGDKCSHYGMLCTVEVRVPDSTLDNRTHKYKVRFADGTKKEVLEAELTSVRT